MRRSSTLEVSTRRSRPARPRSWVHPQVRRVRSLGAITHALEPLDQAGSGSTPPRGAGDITDNDIMLAPPRTRSWSVQHQITRRARPAAEARGRRASCTTSSTSLPTTSGPPQGPPRARSGRGREGRAEVPRCSVSARARSSQARFVTDGRIVRGNARVWRGVGRSSPRTAISRCGRFRDDVREVATTTIAASPSAHFMILD